MSDSEIPVEAEEVKVDYSQVECETHGRMPAAVYSINTDPFLVVCFKCRSLKECEGLTNFVK